MWIFFSVQSGMDATQSMSSGDASEAGVALHHVAHVKAHGICCMHVSHD